MAEEHRLAYLVIAHADPQHLGRLVRALGPDDDVFVHLDAKVADDAPFRAAAAGANVRFVAPRVRVAWAGISMVDATLVLLRAALAAMTPARPYGHLVLLSGACYPLRAPAEIRRRLAAEPEREFIRFIDMRASPDHYMQHLNRRWFKEPWYRGRRRALVLADKVLRRIANLARRPNRWPDEWVPYFGSQWWALTPACARHVVDTVEREPRYRAANRDTLAPDEHFFHTLVGNSPYAARATGLEPFRYRATHILANLHLIHGSLSKWYGADDWDEVAASDALFVRKVGSRTSGALLDRIDRERLGR